MPITTFVRMGPLSESAADYLSSESGILGAAQDLQSKSKPHNFLIGTIIQDKTSVQVICEEPEDQDEDRNSTSRNDLLSQIPRKSFRVAFERSLFEAHAPATGKVVEYVQHFFPASQATPDFRARIERDFQEFTDGFSKGVEGRVDLIFGWTLDDVEHEEIKDDKATSFIIVVGWHSMEAFERSLQREEFKNSIRILIAWQAPYKMVSSMLPCSFRHQLISCSGTLNVKLFCEAGIMADVSLDDACLPTPHLPGYGRFSFSPERREIARSSASCMRYRISSSSIQSNCSLRVR